MVVTCITGRLFVGCNLISSSFHFYKNYYRRRDGVMVRASASQSVDLGFISRVESYRKTLKNGIYSFGNYHLKRRFFSSGDTLTEL